MRYIHIPQGLNPYEARGTERVPCWPAHQESVSVGIAVDKDWDAKLNLSVNGVTRTVQGEESKQLEGLTYYSFNLGTFEKNDAVTYWVDVDNRWSFEVLEVQKLDKAQAIVADDGAVCVSFNQLPSLYVRFHAGRLILSEQSGEADGTLVSESDGYIYKDNKSDAQVRLTMEPFAVDVIAPDGKSVAECLSFTVKTFRGIVREYGYSYHTYCQAVYGLGERFCHVNHVGKKLDCVVFDKFTNQGVATYYPIPMYHTDNGHGFYLDTTCVSYYDFGS